MKKIFLLLLILIGVGLLAAPAIIGLIIRAADADMLLTPLAAQTKAKFTRKSVSHGWFQTRMHFDIEHPQLQNFAPDSSHYQLQMRIKHGPVLFTRQGLVAGIAYAELIPELSGPVASRLSAVPAINQLRNFEFSVMADFQKNWQLDLFAQTLEFQYEQQPVLISGLEGKLKISSHNDSSIGLSYDLQQSLSASAISSETPVDAFSSYIEIKGLSHELISLYTGLLADPPQSAATQQLLMGMGDQATLLILQNSLQIDAEITISSFGGEHAGNLAILWPGLPELAHLNDFQLRDAIRALRLDLQLLADEAALHRSPVSQALTAYQQQKLVQSSNGQATVTAALNAGTLIINEQTLSLEPFLSF
jgi:hypothetical protein